MGLVGDVRELVKAVVVNQIVDQLVLARRSLKSQNQRELSPSVYRSVGIRRRMVSEPGMLLLGEKTFSFSTDAEPSPDLVIFKIFFGRETLTTLLGYWSPR